MPPMIFVALPSYDSFSPISKGLVFAGSVTCCWPIAEATAIAVIAATNIDLVITLKESKGKHISFYS